MPHPAPPPSPAPPPGAGALFETPATLLRRRLPDASRAQRVRLARAERQLTVALLAALALFVAALVSGLGSGPERSSLGTGEVWLASLTLASALALWAIGVRLGRPPPRGVPGSGPGSGPGPSAPHLSGPVSGPPESALDEETRLEIPAARSRACW